LGEGPIGEVTSGSFGPSVERGIGIGYVPPAHAAVDAPLQIEIRGRAEAARVARTPFHPSKVKKS
jgi:glycine cleavage system T protein (aminomethyltransferase)